MVSFTNIKLMKKIILCLFVFFISCSSTTESETPTTKEEILPESNVTLPTSETHDHDGEGHDRPTHAGRAVRRVVGVRRLGANGCNDGN